MIQVNHTHVDSWDACFRVTNPYQTMRLSSLAAHSKIHAYLPIVVVVLAHDSDRACTQHVSRCLSNRLLLATFPTLHPCIAMLTCMANTCSVCSTPCPQQPVCTCAPHSPSSCALTWHWRPHAPPDAVAPARRTQGSGCQKAMAAQHSYYSWLAGWQAVVAGC